MIRYRKRPGIRVKPGLPPIYELPEGGCLLLDRRLVELIDDADEADLLQITGSEKWRKFGNMVPAALACLASAGLLVRNEPASIQCEALIPPGPLISVIVITFNAGMWLPVCLHSVARQTYQPLEIIVVDNASSDDSATRISNEFPEIRLIRLEKPAHLSEAINRGIEAAQGEGFIILNQDVELDKNCVSELVQRWELALDAGAVVPKIRLYHSPGFLNGIGNQVSTLSWGWDNGLGHLDLGQFDTWKEVPSACFAAALIGRQSWQKTGPLDERYPFYYEDSDWSYRARLLGLRIIPAPQAVCLHGYAKLGDFPLAASIQPAKLKHVTYGRLRFAWKIFSPANLTVSMAGFVLFEMVFTARNLLRGRLWTVKSIFQGWRDFIRDFREIIRSRNIVQQRRKISDTALFANRKDYPPPLIWRGFPELTWDIIQAHYLPLFLTGRGNPVPEFANSEPFQTAAPRTGARRSGSILRMEGPARLAFRIRRAVQSRISRLFPR